MTTNDKKIRLGRTATVGLSAALFFSASFIACGDKDAMPVASDTFRCERSGLCIYPTGKKSIQGGYREDGDEIKFDVIHRPYHGISLTEVYPWCMRLIDHENQKYWFHDNGHCPESWYRRDGLQHVVGGDYRRISARRDQLSRSLQGDLKQTSAPENRNVALQVLQDMVDDHLLSIDEPGKAHVPVQRGRNDSGKAILFAPSIQELLTPLVDNAFEAESADNQEDDSFRATKTSNAADADDERLGGTNADPYVQTSDDEVPDDDEWPLKKVPTPSDAHSEGTKPMLGIASDALDANMLFFSKGASDGIPGHSPEELIKDPGMEYKQLIVLFSKNVKARIWWGRKTKKHHTATYIEVYHRALGSDEPWSLAAKDYTANHGSSPLRAEMKPYDRCEDTPTTYGQTIWKGECHGGWGLGHHKHLCNDDTRLQIRNAYNIASNKLCEKVDSYHRPWCHKR